MRSGLSPRVRGNRVQALRQAGEGGSIPARAGEPCGQHYACGDGEVYPARAGEPLHHSPNRFRTTVYPRACGGTVGIVHSFNGWTGLSPRVRGNLFLASEQLTPKGSIPARAGEPCGQHYACGDGEVYPRACGGTTSPLAKPVPNNGLSPRVRGNRRYSAFVQWMDRSIPARAGNLFLASEQLTPKGSIPARAGEPSKPPQRTVAGPVYPRACGGTVGIVHSFNGWTGLSPRVRGNLFLASEQLTPKGSIPARAGEPSKPPQRTVAGPVYPRACGGTLGKLIVSIRHHLPREGD